MKGFFEDVTSLSLKQLVHAKPLRKKVNMPVKLYSPNRQLKSIRFLKRNLQDYQPEPEIFYKKMWSFAAANVEAKVWLMVKLVAFVWNDHFKVCCPCISKNVHEIERDESDEHSDKNEHNFLLKKLMFRNLYILTKQRMKTLVILSSNERLFYYKISTGAHCNTFFYKTWSWIRFMFS